MEIRAATEEDRNEIAKVYADAFYEEWKQLSHDKEKIARALKNGLRIKDYIVAICDKKVIAFIALAADKSRAFRVPLKDFQKEFVFFKGYMVGMALKSDMERVIPLEKDNAYKDILGVSKEYQHKGVASSLLEHVLNNYNYSSFLLSVTDINRKAIGCYTKNGFKEVRREKIKYSKQRGFTEYIFDACEINEIN